MDYVYASGNLPHDPSAPPQLRVKSFACSEELPPTGLFIQYIPSARVSTSLLNKMPGVAHCPRVSVLPDPDTAALRTDSATDNVHCIAYADERSSTW
jgi:hypothetical protein